MEYRLGISHRWLLTGKGDPCLQAAPSAGGGEATGTERPLRRSLRQPLIITDKVQLERLESLEGANRYCTVACVRDAQALKRGTIREEDIEGYCVIHEQFAGRPENLRCVRVRDDSMAPTLTDGSVAAVDITLKVPRLLDGKILCAEPCPGEVVIRRLRVFADYALLSAENKDQRKYPPIVVNLSEHKDKIIGQVVWASMDLA